MSELSNSFYFKSWKTCLALAPFWWVMGLVFFAYHITAGILLMFLLLHLKRTHRILELPPSCFFLLALSGLYFGSLLIHAPDHEARRATASLYNLSFWIMGLCLIAVMANTFKETHIRPFLKAFLVPSLAFTFCAFLAFVAIMKGETVFHFETPFYFLTRYLGFTPLVEQSLTVDLLTVDWFASLTRARFNALLPYATATSGTLVMVIIMLVTWGRIERKLRHPAFLFMLGGNLLALSMTLSRTSILALGVSFVVVYLVRMRHSLLWILLLLVVTAVLWPILDSFLGYVLKLRQASTDVRFALYRYSIEQMEGADWILGKGLKPLDESAFTIPIGSHSTYVSLLFRTGLFGFFSFVGFQGYLLLKWLDLKKVMTEIPEQRIFWEGIGWVLVAMNLWMLTDDIDAPQLLAFIYFSIVGAFEGVSAHYYKKTVKTKFEIKPPGLFYGAVTRRV